ncbi:MAG: PilZ domain-containing protein [Rhizobiaceae bacterium]|nr:PilZ domain-containing protein [Rhizobiaceae bacterium]
MLFNRPDEKRASRRRPANDLSQILFGNQAIGCLVHNISDEGAMIEVSTSQVPDRFILLNYKSANRMVCEVVWRDHLRIGVKFVTIPKPFNTGF